MIKNKGSLIEIHNCEIKNESEILIHPFSWKMNDGETWVICGSNQSGKSLLGAALSGTLEVCPSENGFYSNSFKDSVSLVSFESAAALIEEERLNDDSEFIDGGVDKGRTVLQIITEALPDTGKTRVFSQKENDTDLIINLCGITEILDRGIKYLSTGEIRRSLLCQSLLLKPSLLILEDPFDGLDIHSKNKLVSFLENLSDIKTRQKTVILLILDRFENLPNTITHVLEFSDKKISFCGKLEAYKKNIEKGKVIQEEKERINLETLQKEFTIARNESQNRLPDTIKRKDDILVEMKNVTVEWSGKKVLENLDWKLVKGEHWLIRGPNGSGKTTFLELITGDNPQVFRNDISLFGLRRGSGETIWELKERMGIVSYRLHLEYRNLGSLCLEDVVLSGLHDSIGLYQYCGENERTIASKWLNLCGFGERGNETFSSLSYGEQRAILIVRAAIKCPEILILDEPCHGLDNESRIKTLSLLQSIAEGGTSSLLHVTHDPTEALPCEHHILELTPNESPMFKIIER